MKQQWMVSSRSGSCELHPASWTWAGQHAADLRRLLNTPQKDVLFCRQRRCFPVMNAPCDSAARRARCYRVCPEASLQQLRRLQLRDTLPLTGRHWSTMSPRLEAPGLPRVVQVLPLEAACRTLRTPASASEKGGAAAPLAATLGAKPGPAGAVTAPAAGGGKCCARCLRLQPHRPA